MFYSKVASLQETARHGQLPEKQPLGFAARPSYKIRQVSYLCEGQLRDGSQGQVGVKKWHAVCHTHGATRRTGRQQQAVDAAARKQAAVQVHLHVSPTGQLHFAHDGKFTETWPKDPKLSEAGCAQILKCFSETAKPTVVWPSTQFHANIM